MKEIIYLDTDLINSLLAQLDKGLITSFSAEQNTQEGLSEGQQSGYTKQGIVKGGVQVGGIIFGKAGVDSQVGTTSTETENTSRTFLEGEKDILNKAFHDYSLNILEQKLTDKNILKHGPNFNEGDIHLGEATYQYYDFNLINKIVDVEAFSEIMSFGETKFVLSMEEAFKINTKKTNKNTSTLELAKITEAKAMIEKYEQMRPLLRDIKQMEIYSSFANKFFGESSIIKMGNKVGLLKKEYLREGSESLSLRTDDSRKIKFLVRILGVKKEIYDGNSDELFNPSEINLIPNMIFDVILGSMQIVKVGDVLVTPLAIYYE